MSVVPTNTAAAASIAASVSGVKSKESEATNKARRKADAETTLE